jgi:hypothetical protein
LNFGINQFFGPPFGVLHHLARHVIPLTGDPILAQFQKSHFDFVFVTHSDVVDRPETLRAVPGGLCELGLDENVQIVAQDVLRFQFDHLPPVFGGLHVLQHFFGAVSRDEERHRARVASGDVESDAQVFGG